MIQHDYKRRAELKPIGKGVVYLVMVMAITNALLIVPALYILK